MPLGLVGPGGSRGVQETGAEINASLTNKIIASANQLQQGQVQKVRTQQYIQGRAAIKAGQSIQEVREAGPILNRIFGGGATLAGAQAQAIVQAGDAHALSMQENMHKYREQDTPSFVAAQEKYVTDNLLTGDESTDTLITLAAGESIAKAASVHMKQHAVFVQEKNRIEYENTVSGASALLQNSLEDKSMTTQDKVDALYTMQERMQQQPGQSFEAWQRSLSTVMQDEIQRGNVAFYEALVGDSMSIDGFEIDTGKGMLFDADTTMAMEQMYAKAMEQKTDAQFVETQKSFADLKNYANSGVATELELGQRLDIHMQQHGRPSADKVINLYTAVGKKNVKASQDAAIKTAMYTGKGATLTKTEKGNGLEMLKADLDNIPGGENKDQQIVAAKDTLIDFEIQYNEVTPSVANSWNASLNQPIMDDKISPAYVEAYKSFIERYEKGGEMYSSALKPPQRNTALGIHALVKGKGLSIEEAIRQEAAAEMTYDEAQVFLKSNAYRSKREDSLEELQENNWIFADGKFKGINNPATLALAFNKQYSANVMVSGDTEGSYQGTMDDLERMYTVIDSKAVPIGARKFMQAAGVSASAEVTPNKIIQYAKDTQAKAVFGEGADPDQVKAQVIMTPTEPVIQFEYPGEESVIVPISTVGKHYQDQVVNPKMNEVQLKGFKIQIYKDIAKEMLKHTSALTICNGRPPKGNANDVRTLAALMDSEKGASILEKIPQITTAITEGSRDTAGQLMKALAEVTGFDPVDEATPASSYLNTKIEFSTPRVQSTVKDVLNTIGHKADAELTALVQTQESSDLPSQISPAGALGPMQIMPDTAKFILGRELTEAEKKNDLFLKKLGKKYLDSRVEKYGVKQGLAAYNGGERAVQPSEHCKGLRKWECGWDNAEHTIPNTGYQETREYVQSILSKYKQ